MWKEYLKGYIKNNRASSVSVMVAAFIATLFLSVLCTTAYNFWVYEIEKIVLEEGGWQGRIVGKMDEEGLSLIRNYKNVDKAVVNEELSTEEQTVVDVYFQNARRIYYDMPLIGELLGVGEDAVSYHELLLSRYFIHNPQDADPPLLMALYLGILLIVSVSLILIIRNSFELSMNARIHQFGIFSSVGATPRQIRICLMQEAASLSALPMMLGSLLGIAIGFCLIEAMNFYAGDVSGRHEAVFQYHPFICLVTILSSALTVFFSAWLPAGKLSRMTPLEAIQNTDSRQLMKRKHSRILSTLFGIKGELAGNALKAQKKSLRISALSLTLSFMGFSFMLMFTTLSKISIRYTYFERYQDAWDVMITVKNTTISDFNRIKELRAIPGAGVVTVYQKAEAAAVMTEDMQSDALYSLGGIGTLVGRTVEEGRFWVKVPIVILDDKSFCDYCQQVGAAKSLDGAIVLNQVWDSVNSNFRYKKYIPFIKEDKKAVSLSSVKENGGTVEIPVLAYTQTVPLLREEYENNTLVHFMPLSLWRELSGEIGNGQEECFIRIFSDGDAGLDDLNRLEKAAAQIVGQAYEYESENRVKERISNDKMIVGMMVILGAFCVLLAIIGIANVFLNTLGFLCHRKREFARYMSIGLTPKEMREMFCIEAFVIAGKPLFITVPLTLLFIQFMVTASYLDPMVFWAEAPILPVLLFAFFIIGFVALAYYIGGKRLLRCDLNH